MIVLVDNGHGKNTPGKRSPDGRLLEYKYTREIADEVVAELLENKINSKRIVMEDEDISLQERCNRVNKICKEFGSKNVILVSIHCNAAGSGQWLTAKGWECYTTPGITNSDELATHLYASAEKILIGKLVRKDNSDKDPDKESNFYILKNTNCAAVLTENLFQDNKEEVDFLLSNEGRKSIVNVHVQGILNYLNKK